MDITCFIMCEDVLRANLKRSTYLWWYGEIVRKPSKVVGSYKLVPLAGFQTKVWKKERKLVLDVSEILVWYYQESSL